MHIFLQGPPRLGKSSLLQEVLKPVENAVIGYCTQRLWLNKTDIGGYRAVKIYGKLPSLEMDYAQAKDNIFLNNGRRDIGILEDVITQVATDCQKYPGKIVLLDEIGGVELKSAIFMDTLLKILKNSALCVGVFKSADNFNRTRNFLQLDDSYEAKHQELEADLLAWGRLLLLTEDNRNSIKKSLKEALSSYYN